MNSLARWHLTTMLDRHRQQCRTDGLPVPVEVVTFIELVAGRSSGAGSDPVHAGQGRSSRDYAGGMVDAALVPPLAHDLADTGRMLGGRSERTVRRLIAAGDLEAVPIGASRVVARSEIEAFLERRKGTR